MIFFLNEGRLSFFVNFSVYSRYSQEAHDHKQETMLWQ